MAVYSLFERLLGVSNVDGIADFAHHFVHNAVLPALTIISASTNGGPNVDGIADFACHFVHNAVLPAFTIIPL